MYGYTVYPRKLSMYCLLTLFLYAKLLHLPLQVFKRYFDLRAVARTRKLRDSHNLHRGERGLYLSLFWSVHTRMSFYSYVSVFEYGSLFCSACAHFLASRVFFVSVDFCAPSRGQTAAAGERRGRHGHGLIRHHAAHLALTAAAGPCLHQASLLKPFSHRRRTK